MVLCFQENLYRAVLPIYGYSPSTVCFDKIKKDYKDNLCDTSLHVFSFCLSVLLSLFLSSRLSCILSFCFHSFSFLSAFLSFFPVFLLFPAFFLSWVSKTQPNHWTKRMANTRFLSFFLSFFLFFFLSFFLSMFRSRYSKHFMYLFAT